MKNLKSGRYRSSHLTYLESNTLNISRCYSFIGHTVCFHSNVTAKGIFLSEQ